MKNTWQLQDAKNKFSQVVEQALLHGPQTVTRHGIATVVVISKAEFDKLTAPKKSLVEFFRDSPLAGSGIDLTRRQTPLRPGIDL